MFDWFFALEQSNKVVISLFTLGAAWGGVKIYANSVKPKRSPLPEPTQIIRFTIDEYESRIQAKIATALKERDHASGKDLDIKNAQIGELKNDLVNIEQSFEKQKQFITKLEAQLIREGNTLGADDLEKATQALEAGDTSLAESLFQQIKDSNALNIQASARASFALGEIAEEEVRWQEAFAHYREAARLHSIFEHLNTAQRLAHRIADFPEAESLAKAALRAAEQEFGTDSSQYGSAQNNFASVLQATGRYEQAEPLYRQALENARAAHGENHSGFGVRLNNLAELLKATGRYGEAEPLYWQALENAREALGEEHPDFGICLNNLAGLLEATERFAEAESLYRQALEIVRGTLGEDHIEFGRCLNNLAGLLHATGRHNEAEPFYQQALAIVFEVLGSDHPTYGMTLNNLAEVLQASGLYGKAGPLYRQALENTRAALGEDHPQFGITLNNLAGLLKATGRFEEAEPLYRQAVEVFEKALGPDHPNTQTVKANFESFLANRPSSD
ncbi:MAG: tetratricopeptide repeat protein [Rhodobacteraceae bacterium]|nr:tetratricopeptide repeat protein [Paracoccaceae bacterium]